MASGLLPSVYGIRHNSPSVDCRQRRRSTNSPSVDSEGEALGGVVAPDAVAGGLVQAAGAVSARMAGGGAAGRLGDGRNSGVKATLADTPISKYRQYELSCR